MHGKLFPPLPIQSQWDTKVRFTKVEVEVDTNKSAITSLERAVDELRAAMERGFVEQRATTERGLAEFRKEMNTSFRWLYGLVVTNMTFTFGIVLHLAGVM